PSAEEGATYTSPDYYVLENTNALPRVFVPTRIEILKEGDARLTRMASPDFDPRKTAFVEGETALHDESRGQAEIKVESPTHLEIQITMETPGLVVLADSWDKGWRAYLDGSPVPIMRTDHALRGVVAPMGRHTLQFRYEPASLTWGLRLAGAAGLGLI